MRSSQKVTQLNFRLELLTGPETKLNGQDIAQFYKVLSPSIDQKRLKRAAHYPAKALPPKAVERLSTLLILELPLTASP